MSKNRSFESFLVLFALLLLSSWYFTGKIVPPAGDRSVWFYGGLLTLMVGKFIVEYRLTKPNDVFVNTVAAFVTISTLNSPPHAVWWEILRWGALACGIMALLLAWDPGREARLTTQPVRTMLFRLTTRLGSAEVLSSLVFVLALVTYMDLQDPATRAFALLWGLILLTSHLRLSSVARLFFARARRNRELLGMPHSFLAPTLVFCRKLVPHRLEPYEVVGFTQSPGGDPHSYGMVIDERVSATETLATVALLNVTVRDSCLTDRSHMIRLSGSDLEAARGQIGVEASDALIKVIGTIAKGSSISQIKFEVFGSPPIVAGSLLGVSSAGGVVYYQVFEGVIDEELTLRESTRAFVQGQAEQVGTWRADRAGFDTHDWVAGERSLVHLIDENAPAPAYETTVGQATLGTIPQSPYPVNVSIDDLVLFHTGILGVTGSGKSFLTYDLVEQCAKQQIKVVCVDPTGDYQRYLRDAVLLGGEGSLAAFLASSEHRIAILETAATNAHPIRQAANVARECLEWCKRSRTDGDVLNPKPKLLIVFEEAHLLIPEWSFNPDRALQDVVSVTSQIVLQSRKYGLGFCVISQRTANVVKSVLNQCNTVISFQAFDETGFDFLRNYMGSFHVRSLPNLKRRHGIIVGKASSSRRPIMVRFREQVRELRANPAPRMPVPAAAPDAPE